MHTADHHYRNRSNLNFHLTATESRLPLHLKLNQNKFLKKHILSQLSKLRNLLLFNTCTETNQLETVRLATSLHADSSQCPRTWTLRRTAQSTETLQCNSNHNHRHSINIFTQRCQNYNCCNKTAENVQCLPEQMLPRKTATFLIAAPTCFHGIKYKT